MSEQDYRNIIARRAMEMGLDPQLMLRLARQESNFNPSAKSPKGARGLFQLMPGTAKELGVDPDDPLQNIEGGLRYFRQQLDKYGDVPTALAAYNAGPGRADRYGADVPFEETQNYIRTITSGYGGTGYYDSSDAAARRIEAGGTGSQGAITAAELAEMQGRTAAEVLMGAGEYGDPSLLASEIMRQRDKRDRTDRLFDAMGVMGQVLPASGPSAADFLSPNLRRGRAGAGDAALSRFRDPMTGRGLGSLGIPGFAERTRR